jgi:hypothetical protein
VNYLLTKKMGLPCINMIGTNAHEMRMVTSILYPQLDQNSYSLPLSQLVSDYLYYRLVWSKTKGAGPALSDTVGSRPFLKAAAMVQFSGIPDTPTNTLLNLIGLARQDSGDLKDFLQNLKDFGYPRGKMASEIDTCLTLLKAAKMGYGVYGAGGFFGDSIKVWSKPNGPANSMAVKAVRVMYNNTGGLPIAGITYMEPLADSKVIGYPVKLGDTTKVGKLSIDKSLPLQKLLAIKTFYTNMKANGGKPGETYKVLPDQQIDITNIFDFKSGQIFPLGYAPGDPEMEEGRYFGGRRRTHKKRRAHHKKTKKRAHRK